MQNTNKKKKKAEVMVVLTVCRFGRCSRFLNIRHTVDIKLQHSQTHQHG